jgi:Flp pilus assembly protein TadG
MLLLRKKSRKAGGGQALVEFALVLPIVMLILMGIIQFGFLFSSQIGVINAVREATRFGSTSIVNDAATATNNAANVCRYLLGTSATVPNAMSRVPGYSETNVQKGGATYVTYESYPDPHSGTATYSVRLTLHVEYKHPLLVPIVSAIIDGLDGATDNRFKLGAGEAMRVENPTTPTNPSLSTTVACP